MTNEVMHRSIAIHSPQSLSLNMSVETLPKEIRRTILQDPAVTAKWRLVCKSACDGVYLEKTCVHFRAQPGPPPSHEIIAKMPFLEEVFISCGGPFIPGDPYDGEPIDISLYQAPGLRDLTVHAFFCGVKNIQFVESLRRFELLCPLIDVLHNVVNLEELVFKNCKRLSRIAEWGTLKNLRLMHCPK